MSTARLPAAPRGPPRRYHGTGRKDHRKRRWPPRPHAMSSPTVEQLAAELAPLALSQADFVQLPAAAQTRPGQARRAQAGAPPRRSRHRRSDRHARCRCSSSRRSPRRAQAPRAACSSAAPPRRRSRSATTRSRASISMSPSAPMRSSPPPSPAPQRFRDGYHHRLDWLAQGLMRSCTTFSHPEWAATSPSAAASPASSPRCPPSPMCSKGQLARARDARFSSDPLRRPPRPHAVPPPRGRPPIIRLGRTSPCSS
jgi:hypothetical protein